MPTPVPASSTSPKLYPRPLWLLLRIRTHEDLYGPLPNDVVETQGQNLVTQPNTPVNSVGELEAHDFAAELEFALKDLIARQRRRHQRYGYEAAEEWPISRTPGKLRRAQRAQEKASTRAMLEEQEECESDVQSLLYEVYGSSPASTASVRSPYRVPLLPPPESDSQQGKQSNAGSPQKRTVEQMEEADGSDSRIERRSKSPRVDTAHGRLNHVRDGTSPGENGHDIGVGRQDLGSSPADRDVRAAGLEGSRQLDPIHRSVEQGTGEDIEPDAAHFVTQGHQTRKQRSVATEKPPPSGTGGLADPACGEQSTKEKSTQTAKCIPSSPKAGSPRDGDPALSPLPEEVDLATKHGKQSKSRKPRQKGSAAHSPGPQALRRSDRLKHKNHASAKPPVQTLRRSERLKHKRESSTNKYARRRG